MIELSKISKKFGNLVANYELDFNILNGKIHVLAGENGAGKSTLMKILFGIEQPDTGTILIDGQSKSFKNPKDAIENKIAMVQQHFHIVPHLSIAENVVLGSNNINQVYFDRKQIISQVQSKNDILNLGLDCSLLAGDLSADLQQKAEILKALYKDAQYLILDEPTSLLGPQQIENLFKFISEFKEKGGSVVLITHKLTEVMELADDVSVIRGGKNVCFLEKGFFDEKKLASAMLGRDLNIYEKKKRKINSKNSKNIFNCRNISILKSNTDVHAIENLSFSLSEGEVIGIAGVEGNGQREIIQFLFGQIQCDNGAIDFKKTDVTDLNTNERRLLGMAFIPEDRHAQGLLLDMDICENLSMRIASDSLKGESVLIDWKLLYSKAKDLLKLFEIKPENTFEKTGNLSGGNQQKVVVARETNQIPKLLIASNPTWGLDVGAINFVHNRINYLKENGCGVILCSSDLQELTKLSDKIIVLYRGIKTLEMSMDNFDMQKISMAMAGKSFAS